MSDKGKEGGRIQLFAAKLKALREAANLSQAALASAAGVHISVVFKIEQGVRIDPSWSTVQALAAALGVTCEAFADCDDMRHVAPVKKPVAKKAQARPPAKGSGIKGKR